jgi:acetyl-CoA carboxylase biotin carboxyl carrier protein
MASNPKTNGLDVFDIKRIEQLIDLMSSNNLTEIALQQGEVHIQLKRNFVSSASSLAVPQVVYQNAQVAPAQAAASPKENVVPKENGIDDKKSYMIKSPMVGTFYSATSPEATPFVKVGDMVTPDKTICLIEAMKVYNEIQAECSGKIVAVLARNGEAVEFGKPLFQIATE